MGLLNNIFGSSSSTESARSLKRRKSLRNRRCRIEEMEPRELLSATPYEAPDPINVGVVYHEDYYYGYQDGVQDEGGDTFIVSWTGGVEGTTLDRIVIDLNKIEGQGGSTANLHFNPDGQKRPNGYGTFHPFDYDLDENDGNDITAKGTVSTDGKVLTIDFTGFTSEKVFHFKIDVDELQGGLKFGVDRHVSGNEMEGANVTSYFSAENYEDVSTTAMMIDAFEFGKTPDLESLLPGDEYVDPTGTPDTVNTAGALATLEIQTPLQGSISGFVYEDVNNDGIKQTGESGIAGVLLELHYKDATGKYVTTGLTTKTGADGSYQFDGIPGGVTYMVVETQPAAYADGIDTPGTIGEDQVGESAEPDRLTEIHIGANEHGYNYNFGELKRASISGYVYHDRNNDGVRDSGEEGIRGVTVKLQVLFGDSYVDVAGQSVRTDAEGKYLFEGLDPFQTYRVVEVDQPAGYADGKESVGWIGNVNNTVGRLPSSDNDTIENIDIGYDEHGYEYNFGEYKKGSITGYVYEDEDNDGTKDPDEPGIPNVEVWLCVLDENGNKVNIKSTFTDANGHYSFDDLDPGRTYCVTEVDPEGYCDGETTIGTIDGEYRGSINVDVPADKDQIHDIYLGSGENGVNYNFAENRYGTLGGYVYLDANENGMKDGGEIGLSGVLLTLWAWSDTENDYVQTKKTAETDADGYYEFTELCPFVKFQIREAQPEDYDDGAESVGTVDGKTVGKVTGNDVISDIVLTPGGKGENYNFGELEPPPPPDGSLSGYVYVDKNKNGTKQSAEKGIAGVTLYLWKFVDGEYVKTGDTATTDATGYYRFENLPPNETYMISETQPEAYDDGEETIGSLGGRQTENDKIENIFVGPGQHGENYNFGELEKPVVEPEKGSLSGYVYVDANKSGTKDSGETGIGGVTLTLWKLVDGTYVKAGKTATTNSQGYYIFSNLDPNETYMIAETQPEAYDDGAESVGTLGGKLPSIDDDTIYNIQLKAGQHGKDYNFGEHEKTPPDPDKGSLSGYVYLDKNKNGTKQSAEPGIAGVTISLWQYVDGKHVDTGRTAITDSNGYYIFTNLDPNETYMLVETHPKDYDDGAESLGTLGGKLPSPDNDKITGIFVGEGQDGINYNFGELEKDVPPPDPEKGSLSGYVYADANKNGKKDSGENGIGGVTLTLWKLDDDGEYVNTGKTTKTDSRGFYIFTNLDPDETYLIQETQPTAYDDGRETVGSLGGELPWYDNDTITDIELGSGQHGTNYNFGEIYKGKSFPTPPAPVVLQGSPGLPSGGGAAPNWQPPIPSGTLQAGYGGGGLPSGYSWHLSVINAGYPRTDAQQAGARSLIAARTAAQKTMLLSDTTQVDADLADAKARYVSVAWTPLPMKQSVWYVRGKDGKVTKRFKFGPDGGTPVVADFSGDGLANLAVFHNGNWYIDLNGNGVWDEEDLWCELGTASDQPVVGDWDGDGKADIGIFGPQWSGDAAIVADEPGLPSDLNVTITARPKNMPPEVGIDSAASNVRAMKHSNRGQVRLDVIDHVFQYGGEGDRAFTGDFSGDGITKIGIYRNGKWYIDHNGNGRWDEGDIFVDNQELDGIPVVGDWNGDGIDKIGLYANGVWHLDTTGDFAFDTKIEFGQAGDVPVVGDFDGDGITQLAVYRAEKADSLYARSTPSTAPAEASGRTASQFDGEQESTVKQGTLPEELQRHGRSMRTPHTNAPLQRNR